MGCDNVASVTTCAQSRNPPKVSSRFWLRALAVQVVSCMASEAVVSAGIKSSAAAGRETDVVDRGAAAGVYPTGPSANGHNLFLRGNPRWLFGILNSR